jgi:hypothetical protein
VSWIKLDDGYPEHPKIADASDAAFRADIEGACLSARAKRDGELPASLASRLWSRKTINELVARGRWHRGHGCGSETCILGSGEGYVVHDFLRYNPSSAKRDATSDARRDAARTRWGDANSTGSPDTLALGAGDRSGDASRVGVGKSKESADFVTFYEHAYPRREGRGAARKAWEKAVLKAEPSEIIEGAARFAADPNREPAYTPHPATWLNQERWSDDPLPNRNGKRREPGADLLAKAAALRERDSR